MSMIVKQSLFAQISAPTLCIENPQLLLSKKRPRRGSIVTAYAILPTQSRYPLTNTSSHKKEPRAKYVSTRILPELFNRWFN